MNGLDFAAKVNSATAVTESGQNFLKNYKAYLFSNPCSCALVNNFIAEAQNYSYDTGIMAALNSVLAFVNENKTSWKLASACESIKSNNSTYNYINRLSIDQVDKLLEMNEAEVVQYIKGGVLRNLMFIPEVRNACKEVYASTVTEVHAPMYEAKTPFSFVIVNENEQIFSVLGKTYRIAENKVEVAKVEDETFNKINSLLPNFKLVDEALEYAYKPNYASDEYKFSIKEGILEFSKGKINEKFDSSAKFLQYADIFSRQLFGKERTDFMNISSNIASVYENAENIVNVDCAKVFTAADGSMFSIVEAADNVNLNVVRSLGAGTSCNNFDYMTEALKEVKRITNIDLTNLYESRVDEDYKKLEPDSYKSIQEQLAASMDAKIDVRKKKIAMLAEQFKYDPIKIQLLNNVAKELSMLED